MFRNKIYDVFKLDNADGGTITIVGQASMRFSELRCRETLYKQKRNLVRRVELIF